MSLDDVMRFCLWLSKQDGMPASQFCYEHGPDGRLAPVDDRLERTGYRLPTEAEWALACRAGSTTYRPYGYSPALLEKYAWFERITDPEPAKLRPNRFGLFDMLGAYLERCDGHFEPFPAPAASGDLAVRVDDGRTVVAGRARPVARGGYFLSTKGEVRSSRRTPLPILPDRNRLQAALRVARTVMVGSEEVRDSPRFSPMNPEQQPNQKGR
jgi:formylglycine-generating enzyme required for sulfatase activity